MMDYMHENRKCDNSWFFSLHSKYRRPKLTKYRYSPANFYLTNRKNVQIHIASIKLCHILEAVDLTARCNGDETVNSSDVTNGPWQQGTRQETTERKGFLFKY